MNIENLKKVRNRIADENNFFDMSIFGHDPKEPDPLYKNAPKCKTASCIAGWAQYEASLEHGGVVRFHSACEDARSYLDMDEAEADCMLHGWWSCNALCNITREETLEYLDYVIETGNVRGWMGVAA